MIEIFFRYRVHPSQSKAFEHTYGPHGPWAQLARAHPGYRRTRLFRHKSDEHVYVSVDVWESKAAYDAFRAEYADALMALEAQLRLLKLEELLLGYYEGDEEYHAPLDTLA